MHLSPPIRKQIPLCEEKRCPFGGDDRCCSSSLSSLHLLRYFSLFPVGLSATVLYMRGTVRRYPSPSQAKHRPAHMFCIVFYICLCVYVHPLCLCPCLCVCVSIEL